MMNLYFNVETEDGQFSENVDELGIADLAMEVKRNNPDQGVCLEIVLEKNGEVFVQEDGSILSALVKLLA